QAVALFRRAGNQEFAIDQSQRDRFTAGHGFYQPLLSSDFSRCIIASTRLRACSLRASRPARSPDSCSWLWRRLRFSSLSRRTVSSRWSSCRPRAANSCWTGSTWSGVLMRETIAGRRRKSAPRSTARRTLLRWIKLGHFSRSRSMTDIDEVGHDQLEALAARLRLGTGASELHGSLTGYLAGGGSLHGGSVPELLELDGHAIKRARRTWRSWIGWHVRARPGWPTRSSVSSRCCR